eukprot:12398208-Karenia_brevis.AAC.1
MLPKTAPNEKQREFMDRIMNWCRQEFQSFLRPNETQYKDDSILDCLLGIPGAGIGRCIKLMQELFEKCLFWEMEFSINF